MMKKDGKWIWLLIGALIIALALGLFLDPGIWAASTPKGNYHIQITEICAKNETVIADNDGKYRDYIELYNAGDDVDLSGCRLTDGTTSVTPFEGIVMGAGEYRVIFLGNDTAGFALSSSGRDSIQLQSPDGSIIAQTKVRALLEDQVMSLQSGAYILSDRPSPGFANNEDGIKAFTEGKKADKLDIQISEVLIANRSTLPDEKGEFSDIVELHNATNKSIRLNGWCLSDDAQQRFRYRLPSITISAGSYLLVHCDGENYVAKDGTIHANFGLNAQETLYLTSPTGAYVTMQPQYSAENMSYALADGNYVAMSPSLGFENTEEGCYNALTSRVDPDSALVISEVLLSASGVPYNGQLTDAVEIQNRSDRTVSTAGWYLSDGGDPYAFPLPEKDLAPGEFITYSISKQTAGFGLSVNETVYLMAPNFLLSQPVTCVQPPEGCSISLVDHQGDAAYDFTATSLGYANNAAGAESFAKSNLIGKLQISEVMSSNSSYLKGPYGNTTDWVELYNAGSTAINLSDYCMTDSSDLQKYPLPNKTLEPGKYTTILLSETGKRLKQGYSWLPFSLSASGDKIYLTKDNQIVDHVIIPEIPSDTPWGRASGKYCFDQLSTGTPGSANSKAAAVSQTPKADLPQGAYNNVDSLTISFSGPGEIYYTTNCSEPTRSSTRYTGPITIKKTTVFRVVSYEQGASRSKILDLTYVVNEGDHLSTVCVVTNPSNLWDYYTGIYVKGPGASDVIPYQGANFWKNWEKSATVSLFETDGTLGFSEPCGLKIFGGYSRSNGKKSFACMFRGKYGASDLDYALFGEDGINCFQSFVLRAGGQDAYRAKIRDEMITSIASDYLGMIVQRYRPVVLYLNGEYWGIYFIREKLTDQYVAGNFGVNAEDVTLGYWSGGDCPPYQALRDYARTHDLSQQEHYDYICSQINEDNYIDYAISQIWVDNTDLGNVKFFTAPGIEWHWILFDTDISFRDATRNSVEKNLTKNNIFSQDTHSKVIMVRLLKNPEFKDKFIRRFAYHLNEVWTEENVVGRIDYFQQLLQADMAKECGRWGSSVEQWEQNLQDMRTFAGKRTGYLLKYIQEFFSLSDQQMRDYGFEV